MQNQNFELRRLSSNDTEYIDDGTPLPPPPPPNNGSPPQSPAAEPHFPGILRKGSYSTFYVLLLPLLLINNNQNEETIPKALKKTSNINFNTCMIFQYDIEQIL